MLLSAVSVLVVAQSSSEIPEGLMNNPVYFLACNKREMLRVHYNILALTTLTVFRYLMQESPPYVNSFLQYFAPEMFIFSIINVNN